MGAFRGSLFLIRFWPNCNILYNSLRATLSYCLLPPCPLPSTPWGACPQSLHKRRSTEKTEPQRLFRLVSDLKHDCSIPWPWLFHPLAMIVSDLFQTCFRLVSDLKHVLAQTFPRLWSRPCVLVYSIYYIVFRRQGKSCQLRLTQNCPIREEKLASFSKLT